MKKKIVIPVLVVVLLVGGVCFYRYSRNEVWQLVEVDLTEAEILKEMPDIVLSEKDYALESSVVALPEVQEAVKKSTDSDSFKVISGAEVASLLDEWVDADRTVIEMTVSGNSVILTFHEGECKTVYYTFSADGSYSMQKTIAVYVKTDENAVGLKCKAIYENDSAEVKKYVNKRKWF